MGASTEEKVVSSVQHLEYAFADAFNKITKEKQKKIAVIKGIGELHDLQIADFLKSVRESYYIGPFTMDSVAKSPQRSLEALKKYDLAIIAKPSKRFTEEEKEVLDQFIINGGKTLWLVDNVQAEMDSLYNETGSILAYPKDFEPYRYVLQIRCSNQSFLSERRTGHPYKISNRRTGKPDAIRTVFLEICTVCLSAIATSNCEEY